MPVEVLKQFVLNFHQTSSQTSSKVLRNLASEHCPPKWVYLSKTVKTVMYFYFSKLAACDLATNPTKKQRKFAKTSEEVSVEKLLFGPGRPRQLKGSLVETSSVSF